MKTGKTNNNTDTIELKRPNVTMIHVRLDRAVHQQLRLQALVAEETLQELASRIFTEWVKKVEVSSGEPTINVIPVPVDNQEGVTGGGGEKKRKENQRG